jgi:hypothetical protein
MQFDGFIKSLLESLEELKLPVFDGKREVYEYAIHSPGARLDNPNFVRVSELTRLTDYDLELLEDEDALDDYGALMLYKGSDINQAISLLYARYEEYYGIELPQHIFDKITNTLGHLKGTWLLIDDSSNSGCFNIGIDVDTAAERAKQIRDNLDNTDTSGLEDLL